MKNRIFIFVHGGIVQSVHADQSVDVVVVDIDCDNEQDTLDKVRTLDGKPVWVMRSESLPVTPECTRYIGEDQ